jgi:hypothetical protein
MNEYLADLTTPHGVEKKLPSLIKGLNDSLYKYGKENKKFGKAFTEAEDIYRGIANVGPTTEFLQKATGIAAVGALTSAVLIGKIDPIKAAKIYGVGVAAREASIIFDMFKNSSSIRNYYARAVASAAKKNLAATVKDIKKLDEAINEYE